MATILSLDSVSSQFHTNSRMPSRNTAFVELTLHFVQSGSTGSSMDSCIDTPFSTRKYRSSGMDGARPFFLRIRRNLMVVIIFTCGTPKLSLNVTPMDEGVTLLRQLAKLLAEILRLQLDPARGPALVRECRRRHALARPIHASHGRPSAQYIHKPRPEPEMTRT